MLEKGAIEEVPPSERYYSHLFLVPKSIGWRPIINLKRLNATFLETPHFRMNTTKGVANLLRPEGCVFPRSDSQEFKEISPLRMGGETISVLRSSRSSIAEGFARSFI